jgi:vesicular inhibitory amino acid transporter
MYGLDAHTQGGRFEIDQKSPLSRARKLNRSLKRLLLVCERVGLACLAVIVSILVPDFGSIMAILGSFTVFALCVIGPIAAKISLERRATVLDVLLMISSIIMALWGTVAALWCATR